MFCVFCSCGFDVFVNVLCCVVCFGICRFFCVFFLLFFVFVVFCLRLLSYLSFLSLVSFFLPVLSFFYLGCLFLTFFELVRACAIALHARGKGTRPEFEGRGTDVTCRILVRIYFVYILSFFLGRPYVPPCIRLARPKFDTKLK